MNTRPVLQVAGAIGRICGLPRSSETPLSRISIVQHGSAQVIRTEVRTSVSCLESAELVSSKRTSGANDRRDDDAGTYDAVSLVFP